MIPAESQKQLGIFASKPLDQFKLYSKVQVQDMDPVLHAYDSNWQPGEVISNDGFTAQVEVAELDNDGKPTGKIEIRTIQDHLLIRNCQ